MWYKVNKRLIGTKQVRPSGWTPWSNTIAYYPFTSNQTDQTWNTSIPATWSKQTIWYRFTLSGQSYIQLSWLPRAPYFISYWMKINSFGNQWSINSIWNTIFWIQYYRSHYNGTWWNKVVIRWSSDILVNWPSDTSQWNHLCYWWDWTNYIIWINGTITTRTGWPASHTPVVNLLDVYTWQWNVDFSDLIIEDSGWIWDSSKIQTYYNATKSKYWY